jgi:hypothetical protein
MMWHRVVDTSLDPDEDIVEQGKEKALDPSGHYLANPRSTVVLVGR